MIRPNEKSIVRNELNKMGLTSSKALYTCTYTAQLTCNHTAAYTCFYASQYTCNDLYSMGGFMPSPNEKLAESLDVLEALQQGNRRVFRSDDLSRVHRERLVENGFL